MRTIRFLLQKEFKQIFRNKAILAMVMVVPVVQLIVLPFAADYEIKNVRITLVDHDHSPYSRRLVQTILASPYFQSTHHVTTYQSALSDIERNRADLILEIPPHFERNLIREKSQSLWIAANAINGVKATIGAAYLNQIIARFNVQVRAGLSRQQASTPPLLQINSAHWYNPHLNYKLLMVPGVLAILVTLIGGYLAALNIVKEKEMGTIEQINVTPIQKYQFILGKLIPFWLLGNVVFTLGLLAAWLVYGIVPLGSIPLLYAFIGLYLLAVLGLGLLISTWCDTQQQAMLIMFFFMMIFILMSGLFTPIESMPNWAQWIARFNPVTYLIEILRRVVLKGSAFSDLLPQFGMIGLFAVILNALAILNYRKSS